MWVMLLVDYGTQIITEQLLLRFLIMLPTQNIGDIAIDWKKGTIWVGTGENNSSRS